MNEARWMAVFGLSFLVVTVLLLVLCIQFYRQSRDGEDVGFPLWLVVCLALVGVGIGMLGVQYSRMLLAGH